MTPIGPNSVELRFRTRTNFGGKPTLPSTWELMVRAEAGAKHALIQQSQRTRLGALKQAETTMT